MAIRRADSSTRQIIEREANANGLDPDFLEAIALQESNANPNQANRLDTNGLTSYGMMQIQLARAQDNGFSQDPSTLGHVETNVHYAARAVAQHKALCQGDQACMAAGYNASKPLVDPDNPDHYINDRYVGNVMENYAEIKGSNYTGSDVAPGLRGKLKTGRRQKNRSPGANDGGASVVYDDPQCNRQDIGDKLFPYPLPPNPNHATASILIGASLDADLVISGGFSLTPARPQYLQYFEYVENLGASTWMMRVFDPNWDLFDSELATHLASASDKKNVLAPYQNVLMSWGYTQNYPGVSEQTNPILWSQLYPGQLMDFSPNFLGIGVEIQLAGVGSLGLSRTETKTVNWKGLTVSEIVKEIAAANQWSTCIEPTAGVPDEDGLPKIITQANKDDVRFIREDLIPLATSAKNEDLSNYQLFFDDSTKTLHFHPFTRNVVSRHYTYARQRNGAIISFNPQINGSFLSALGGIHAIMGGMDLATQQSYEVTVDDDSTPDKYLTGKYRSSDVLTNLNGQDRTPTRNYTSSEGNPQAARFEATNIFMSARNSTLTGTLTVVGDPLIKPASLIRITVFSAENKEHFTSGLYQVVACKHVIQSGSYTTTLDLRRNSLGADPEDLKSSANISESRGFTPHDDTTVASEN